MLVPLSTLSLALGVRIQIKNVMTLVETYKELMLLEVSITAVSFKIEGSSKYRISQRGVRFQWSFKTNKNSITNIIHYTFPSSSDDPNSDMLHSTV